jgi:Flp pilus assembly protein TadG
MKNRSNQRGQEMAELGISMVVLLGLVGAIMAFGYAFAVANMVTHAARDGARLAASWANRGQCGAIAGSDLNPSGPIGKMVTDKIATISDVTFTVTITQNPTVGAPPCTLPAGTVPTVTVNVQGCVPYIFNFFDKGSKGCANGMAVNRDVTFDDELRSAFGS